MPRPVDPERQRARRTQIIAAALSVIAHHGYPGATTAAICRAAGVGSGTFFHYFPTKDALVVAIIATGRDETVAFFDAQRGRTDALNVVRDYVHHALADLRDPRTAGFVTAVTGMMGNPKIVEALADDEQAVRDGLRPWVHAAQDAGLTRADMSDGRLTDWLILLLDGFTARVAATESFDATTESEVLLDQVETLLRPRS